MSADLLRRTAALMRERAGGSTPGGWVVPEDDDEYMGPADVVTDGIPGDRYIICEHAGVDAEHIASWHPAVALAVADWLESQADLWGHPGYIHSVFDVHPATAVARAYLNEEPA